MSSLVLLLLLWSSDCRESKQLDPALLEHGRTGKHLWFQAMVSPREGTPCWG